MFLEPLSHVVGAAKSKDLLLQQCSTIKQTSRLQILGCLLGINDWASTFQQRTELPQDCIQVAAPVVDAVMQEVIEVCLRQIGQLALSDHSIP